MGGARGAGAGQVGRGDLVELEWYGSYPAFLGCVSAASKLESRVVI